MQELSFELKFELIANLNTGYSDGLLKGIHSLNPISPNTLVFASNIDIKCTELKFPIWISDQYAPCAEILRDGSLTNYCSYVADRKLDWLGDICAKYKSTILFKIWLFLVRINRFFFDPIKTPWSPHGSFFILTKPMIGNIDHFFNKNIFLCEEYYFGKAIRNSNLEIINVNIKVDHLSCFYWSLPRF